MEHKKKTIHTLDFFFILSLLGTFVTTAALVIVIGAVIYQSSVSSMQSDNRVRTALSYVTEKIRQNDHSQGIEIRETDGRTLLLLHNTYRDSDYITYIYALEGSLRELTVRASDSLDYEAGQIITEISDFSISEAGRGLFAIHTSEDGGKELSAYVTVKSE